MLNKFYRLENVVFGLLREMVMCCLPLQPVCLDTWEHFGDSLKEDYWAQGLNLNIPALWSHLHIFILLKYKP